MKKLFTFFLLLLTYALQAQTLIRANSFFGIHMDFSPTQSNTNIGGTVTLQNVGAFLDYIKPDFIQVYTKGFTGYACYPTAVGIPAPGIVNNPLPIFRAATLARGMGLYAYYAPLLDNEVIKSHPDWGRLTSAGTQEINGSASISIFSPYVDNYFIPQLKEISNYGFDGYWMDGDCWPMTLDYSVNAANAYKNATGKPLPRSYSDPDMHNYIEFTRQAFHTYLGHYVDVMHQFNPKLQICSNWGFAYMYGPVNDKVDFLSGDMNSDLPNDVEYKTRLLAGNGLPWDLVEWVKPTALPMEKKAAMALAQGGAYTIYITQHTDASINTDYNAQVLATANFCRARKAYCWKTTPIPQVAVLLSEYGYNVEASSIFSITEGTLVDDKTMLNMYLDIRYSTQLLQEHQFNTDLSVYPLIVVPSWRDIDPAFVVKLKQYLYNGGKLFIVGAGANKLFNDVEQMYTLLPNSVGLPVKLFKYGTGTILSIPVDLYSPSTTGLNPAMRAYAQGLVTYFTNILFPAPIISVAGAGNIHINATVKNTEKIFHIINIDSLNTTTSPLSVNLRLPVKPSAIMLQPDNISLSFTYNNGIANLTMPGVNIYSMLEVKN